MAKKELDYVQLKIDTNKEKSVVKIDTNKKKLATDTDKIQALASAPKPSWPPPPRKKKRRSFLKIASLIMAAILATALIFSCLGLVLFKTTKHFRSSIRQVATIEVQQTVSVQTTAEAHIQGTAQYINTAQAHIEATATVQAEQTAQATQTINDATATSTANSSLYQTVTANTPSIDDPLTDNTGTNHWDTGGPDANTGCSFEDSTYHALEARQTYLQPCIAQSTNVTNFAYQANVTILKGDQGQAGLLFRTGSDATDYYFFHIGIDGSYALDLYNGDDQASTLLQGNNSEINVGVGQMNQMMVMADATTITLLANGTYLGAVADDTLTAGQIGVGVVDDNTPIDATFADVQVWKLQ